jgi:hypothetical protein
MGVEGEEKILRFFKDYGNYQFFNNFWNLDRILELERI